MTFFETSDSIGIMLMRTWLFMMAFVLFVFWKNKNKEAGICVCGHDYISHSDIIDMKINDCKIMGCKCKMFVKEQENNGAQKITLNYNGKTDFFCPLP